MNKLDGILCLNLPQSQDRRKTISQEFQKHGMTNKVSWIKAQRPSDLKLKTIKYDRRVGTRCYCQGICLQHRHRKLRPVEIAIAISHRLAYQQMIEQDLDLVMIVEDDVVFHRDFNQILNQLLTTEVIDQLLSKQPYVVFLGGRSNNPGLRKTGQKLTLSQIGSYSNYGYLLNHAGARLLLDNFFPIQRPEDSYKRYLINGGLLKCYQVSPSLIGELSAGINQPAKFKRLSR